MSKAPKTGQLLPNNNTAKNRNHWRGIHGIMTADSVYDYARSGLTMEQIGALYGCGKSNVSQIISNNEEFKEAWNQGHAELLVELMPHIKERMLANDIFLMFCLKAMFGFCEEQHKLGKELDKDNQPRINIYLPSNGRDDVSSEDDE